MMMKIMRNRPLFFSEDTRLTPFLNALCVCVCVLLSYLAFYLMNFDGQ